MTSKKALERIKREAGTPYFSTLYDIDMRREDFRTIEKALEVLEIIIKKGVAVGFIDMIIKTQLGGADEYNTFTINKKMYLTEEEFELLKEWLENEKIN